jgi:hypothetical protein
MALLVSFIEVEIELFWLFYMYVGKRKRVSDLILLFLWDDIEFLS